MLGHLYLDVLVNARSLHYNPAHLYTGMVGRIGHLGGPRCRSTQHCRSLLTSACEVTPASLYQYGAPCSTHKSATSGISDGSSPWIPLVVVPISLLPHFPPQPWMWWQRPHCPIKPHSSPAEVWIASLTIRKHWKCSVLWNPICI